LNDTATYDLVVHGDIALSNGTVLKDGWLGITNGLVTGSSETPLSGIETVEWDHSHGLMKINPLAWWSREELFERLRTREVPYNPLLDDGYRSIGCQPCTRRAADADDPTDERAGRWSGRRPIAN